jgi:hypothetical protein
MLGNSSDGIHDRLADPQGHTMRRPTIGGKVRGC